MSGEERFDQFHQSIVRDLATLKTDVSWIRKQAEKREEIDAEMDKRVTSLEHTRTRAYGVAAGFSLVSTVFWHWLQRKLGLGV
ncbi:MAG: hypothetical protein L0Z53_05520 [Acidobacteriales bacterium]|nr:hypothetical protein [Terriglobales bacterium]